MLGVYSWEKRMFRNHSLSVRGMSYSNGSRYNIWMYPGIPNGVILFEYNS